MDVGLPPAADPGELDARAGKRDDCRGEPGAVRPIVDRNRCEAKSECVTVCPYDVFEVRPIEARDFMQLSLGGKLKSLVHGRRTAYTPRADACRACGLCVTACPEDAIRLTALPGDGS